MKVRVLAAEVPVSGVGCFGYAPRARYKTSISVEPFLDHNPIPLIFELEPYVTESIWIGPMNYIRKNDISIEDLPYYNKIRDNNQKENLVKIYQCLKDHKKIQFKDSFLNRINY